MKKMLLIFMVFIVCLPSLRVFAQEETYLEQVEQSGAGELKSALPKETRDLLEEYHIDLSDMDWISNLNTQNLLSIFGSSLKGNLKTVGVPFLSVILLFLLSFCLKNFSAQFTENETLEYVLVFGICILVISPFVSVLHAVIEAIQSACGFMSALIPVFCGILVSGGYTAVSAGFAGLMLGATQIISYIGSYFVLPLAGIFLALNISFTLSNTFSINGFAQTVKKTATWVLSVSLLLFLGLLKIQTVVQSAADSLTLSTAKFVAGSSIPLVGSAISEAFSTVKGCISLLGSSVGMYGVIAVGGIFLPVFMQMLFWKIGVSLSVAVADLFSLKKISGLLQALADMFSFVLAVLSCVAILFIIGITMVCVGGKL